jgi:hypothetical protein
MGDHLVGGTLETEMEKSLKIGSNTPKFAYVDVGRSSPAALQASESRPAAIAGGSWLSTWRDESEDDTVLSYGMGREGWPTTRDERRH